VIDETRLEELRVTLCGAPHPENEGQREVEELIRLARTGLWAEKCGIPALKEAVELIVSEYCSHGSHVPPSECGASNEKCYARQVCAALDALEPQ
jgi:hypothetical protein